MTREQTVALFARLQAAFDCRDATALAACHTRDGVVDSLMAGRVTGREAITETYQAWFRAFPDVVMTSDDLIIDGHRVALVSDVVGSDIGGFLGLPPTGRPFRLPIIFLYTIDDGLIQHARYIYDFTGLLVQIGVLKARPA